MLILGSRRGLSCLRSDLYCEECGFHTTVPRRPSRQREKGHWKTEFCPRCKKETRFKEVREKDFTIENVLA